MIYAGRFDLDKRIDELLALMKKITPKYKNVFLALIGGGSFAEDIALLHGKENQVYCQCTFLSHEELALFYNACDLHISASQMETLGNTVLESIACGTPVLVPKAQGFVDTVKNGVTGVLWDITDPDAPMKEFEKLYLDKARLRAIKNGTLQNFGELHCASAVKDLIQWYVEASEVRRRKTYTFARILLSTYILSGLFLFDRLIFSYAKAGLESFSDKKTRQAERDRHIKEE